MKDLDLGQDDRKLCILCAWRETCTKRFRGIDAMHCPDFTYDVTKKKGVEDDKGSGEGDRSIFQGSGEGEAKKSKG